MFKILDEIIEIFYQETDEFLEKLNKKGRWKKMKEKQEEMEEIVNNLTDENKDILNMVATICLHGLEDAYAGQLQLYDIWLSFFDTFTSYIYVPSTYDFEV